MFHLKPTPLSLEVMELNPGNSRLEIMEILRLLRRIIYDRHAEFRDSIPWYTKTNKNGYNGRRYSDWPNRTAAVDVVWGMWWEWVKIDGQEKFLNTHHQIEEVEESNKLHLSSKNPIKYERMASHMLWILEI